ncbi:hypothetical protein K504DRAFT_532689 [Pleomassaria siparia CBS 279.74]|uniref:Uncharacterized protein n=1 Tax=Pleomassaria siparia CBS 279.74 TaxID=1314801 RepID=A0A6G1KDQ9_9PLEO|nr:hypothetical protein K504DRAFT_532689 [Pleomassaria siparia CBS 279.74]
MLASTTLMLLASIIPSLAQELSILPFISTSSSSSVVVSKPGPPVVTDSCIAGCGSVTTIAGFNFTATDSGRVSIPQGETGAPTPANSTPSSATNSATNSAPTSSATTGGAAVPGHGVDGSRPATFAMAISALCVTISFAWILL